MPCSCVVMGCSKRDVPENRELGMTFHKLPQNADRRQKWLNAIGRPDWVPRGDFSYHRVCSDHFRNSDYKTKPNKRFILRKEAVPSVFEFDSLSKSRVKRSVKQKGGTVEDLPVTVVPPDLEFDFVACSVDTERERDEENPLGEMKLKEEQSVKQETIDRLPSLPVESGSGLLLHVPPLDHHYAYPNNIDLLRRHCDFLRSALIKKDSQEKCLRRRLSRSLERNRKLRRKLEIRAKKASAKT